MKLHLTLLTFVSSLLLCFVTFGQQQDQPNKLTQIEQSLKNDIPRILCVNENVATGGQPTEQAFSKLAANGFRSVLNLRTASEGVDIKKERASVEGAGMKYISIPAPSNAPEAKHVEEFIKAVKDKANHPMLIHCGSANRVGAFWMIYRVLEEGMAEDRALEEAVKIGLVSPTLKEFAQNYISSHKLKESKTEPAGSGEAKPTTIAEIRQRAGQFDNSVLFVFWLMEQKNVKNVSFDNKTLLTSNPPKHIVGFELDGVRHKLFLVVNSKAKVVKILEENPTQEN